MFRGLLIRNWRQTQAIENFPDRQIQKVLQALFLSSDNRCGVVAGDALS
ncbi:hypothetical protein XA26_55690 [Mycolicibacterium fortuitum]|uniref:Uncharacterized protein n=1 Tax=Mycolicibacterium fortuitum TaxID=1766 RepID=A0A0N7H9L5_MYCFO|nr:hypothetical protein G155_00261 [Mycobacterium sp. VKM Ac-1817D]ALI29359.1 hypothetical protein XA26_55690 [Mycolicibacterium fortuitum]